MNQRSDQNDELVSAYLDGEVTAEEQVRAEHLLAESAEHRRMYDDFCELRDRLQSLPQVQSPSGLQANVLRQIGDSSQSAAAPGVNGSAHPALAEKTESPPDSRQRGWLRGALYAGCAVAAAVLLALFAASERDVQNAGAIPRGERDIVDAGAGEAIEERGAQGDSMLADQRDGVENRNRDRENEDKDLGSNRGNLSSQDDSKEPLQDSPAIANALRRGDPSAAPDLPPGPPRSGGAEVVSANPPMRDKPLTSRSLMVMVFTFNKQGAENGRMNAALQAVGVPSEAVIAVDEKSAKVVRDNFAFGGLVVNSNADNADEVNGAGGEFLCACLPTLKHAKDLTDYIGAFPRELAAPYKNELTTITSDTLLYQQLRDREEQLAANDPDAKLYPVLILIKQGR